MTNTPVRLIRLLGKTALLFVAANLLFGWWGGSLGRLSAYNVLFPARERFPFGENPALAYNLSLFNLDAMFASHVVAAPPQDPDEYRIFLIGDSSVWGILLRPDQTLAGILNGMSLRACGRQVHVYNLGYPTISLAKDIMIMDRAMRYDPDLIVWLTTLEAFPGDKQLASPIVANNPDRIADLARRYQLALEPGVPEGTGPAGVPALLRERRNLADIARLQLLGVPWAATGIDQFYPVDYARAQTDLDADLSFHGWQPPRLDTARLPFDLLDAGRSIAGDVPLILVDEPILVSGGRNSDLRYNFYYPRWAFDQYRQALNDRMAGEGWRYVDLWDAVPAGEYTNSAIHLTPAGEGVLARDLESRVTSACR